MRFITFLCCVMVASVSFAKDYKVGTVDLKKLFNEFPGKKAGDIKMKELIQEKQADLLPLKKDLEKLQTELESSSAVLTKAEKKEKQYEFQKKMDDFTTQQKQMQSELADKDTEMTEKLLDQIKVIIGKIAKDKGVDLILDSDKTVYARDAVDLTEDVLKSYKDLPAVDTDK